LKAIVSLCLTKWRGEQKEIFYGPPCTLGNTGVTKIGVVGRGTLRRDEAREYQKYRRGKDFRMKGVAGSGE
jgi:hypothetical protein